MVDLKSRQWYQTRTEDSHSLPFVGALLCIPMERRCGNRYIGIQVSKVTVDGSTGSLAEATVAVPARLLFLLPLSWLSNMGWESWDACLSLSLGCEKS